MPMPTSNASAASPFVIRPAREEDADAIGLAHVQAWQQEYRGTMPDAYLDGLRAEDRADGWRRSLASPDAGRRLLVAAIDVEIDTAADDVVGFVAFGRCRDEPSPGDERADDDDVDGELFAVNLAPRAWGRGIGRALVRAAGDGLTELGHHTAVLWVVPGNARARGLYESERWETDGGAREFELYGVIVPEVRYRHSLSRP